MNHSKEDSKTEKIPFKIPMFKFSLRGNGLVLHKKIDMETVGKILQVVGYWQKLEQKENLK